jgi:hypothetical protein
LSPVPPSEFDDWFVLKDGAQGDPICFSPNGMSYEGMGCFPLGVDVTIEDFQDVCWSQRNLRKLDLLDSLPTATLQSYGAVFDRFITEFDSSVSSQHASLLYGQDDIRELSKLLSQTSEECIEGIRIFVGLHSGFQKRPRQQFWAVYNVHNSITDIFLSKDAQDVMGTILHTFLSCRGLTRRQCFTAEFLFARWNDTLVVPNGILRRTIQDLSRLTPEECMVLLQQITFSETEDDSFLAGVKSTLAQQLIDKPSMHQLKELGTAAYLNGSVTREDLVAARLRWHCQRNQPHPNLSAAVDLFSEVEATVIRVLRDRNRDVLQSLTDALDGFLGESITAIDATADTFALSLFCTMQKLAFEEVYMEVTDRNPLFNDQPDQAAAFAELFALGSRCESYFDMTPSQFGELLSKRYRDHYSVKQPPPFEESKFALSSAFAEAQIDVDPNFTGHEMPSYQRFTFLSVFAIPALIDILMLTTTGHGLYLSSYMTEQEQHSATVALMLSLLLSGAIGTWITCGGTYYLASMAFSAMNLFVITRLLGGFAFTLIVGFVGFVAFTCMTGVRAGLVFFLYLIALTTYLCLLAALANFQFSGSTFQSVCIYCVTFRFQY